MICCALRQRVLLALLILGIGFGLAGGQVFADNIYFSGDEEAKSGQVIEETESSFVVRFPKAEIRRIEADQKPSKTDAEDAERKVLWQEDERYITISFPKEQVTTVRVSAQAEAVKPAPAAETTSLIAVPQATPPVLGGAGKGAIQGRVLWDGSALANCEVKMVRVGRSRASSVPARLRPGEEEEGGSRISLVTTTVAGGNYRFSDVVPGEYDIYWRPLGQEGWVRKLSEYPDILVVSGEVTKPRDIEAHVRTIN